MNRDQIRAALPILQAFAEGKTIQSLGDDGTWRDVCATSPDYVASRPDHYRIKPEPREWWLTHNLLGGYVAVPVNYPGAIHVREVLD